MMSEANRRGLRVFIILMVALVACALITFIVLPGAGIAVALPVITVPGEAYNGALPSQDVNFTNTIMATLLADAAVLVFLFFAWRSSNGWKREVPNRFQAWVELVGEFMYNQTKSFAGNRPLARRWLFPLAATIFVFLLAANWMKLLPGVESVGVLHCAHPGISGYPAVQVGAGAYQLYVPQALYAGQAGDEADYEACEHFLHSETHVSKASLGEAADTLKEEETHITSEFESGALTADERDAELQLVRLEATEGFYEHASFALTSDELRSGVIPYIQVVTPFVRGAATDLNLTIGLALVTFFAIQVFGVAAQGPAYFQKFINIHALGTMSKNPLGAVDFLVGIFEIVSEIGKIISLAFRLFGNMFAGGILLAVMSFLVATLLPVVFIGLEVIVTTIQAYVFAVLTIVFSAQAMEGHAHDDEEHHEHGGTSAQEPEHDMPIERNAI